MQGVPEIVGELGVLSGQGALLLPGLLKKIGLLGAESGYHLYIMPSKYIKDNIVIKSIKS